MQRGSVCYEERGEMRGGSLSTAAGRSGAQEPRARGKGAPRDPLLARAGTIARRAPTSEDPEDESDPESEDESESESVEVSLPESLQSSSLPDSLSEDAACQKREAIFIRPYSR